MFLSPSFELLSTWYSSVVESEMVIPICYAIVFGSLCVLWLLSRLVYWVGRMFIVWITFFILKHCIYPRFPWIPILRRATRYQVAVWSIYMGINIACMTARTTSRADISARSATMAIINIVPLLCGPRLVLMTELMGMTLRTQHVSHQWFGRTAMAQALVHSVIWAAQTSPFRWSKQSLTGVVGSSLLGLILLLSLRPVRRLVYECFLKTHFLLAAAVLLAIGLHVAQKKPLGRVFIYISVGMWTAMTVLHGVYFAIQNFARGKSAGVVRVTGLPNALHIQIQPPRTWQPKAGQFVYLSLPGAGYTSALQFHPFMIAWWERGAQGLRIWCLVKPRRGITARLAAIADQHDVELSALMDGPYGRSYDFGDFASVVMFATGVGIAGQLLYIKELVLGYNDCTVRTRRIVLVWQVDREVHEQWVKAWMDQLLEMDTGYILKIDLYVREKSPKGPGPASDGIAVRQNERTVIEYGTHGRINKIFGPPDIDAILTAEIAGQKGNMVVSVCASPALAAEIRSGVQEKMGRGVRLVELDFEPSFHQQHRRGRGWFQGNQADEYEMDFQCRGVV